MTRGTLVALTGALTLTLFVPAAHAAKKQKPSATLELTEGSVAAGIGFSWGGGTLTYQGKKYPVSVDGLTVGSVGITDATAKGNVYGLKHLKDFNGVYTAVKAGATVGGGGGALAMQNQNGVVVHLVSTTQGVKLTLGAGGVKMEVKK